MTVRRIVPDLTTASLADATAFYQDVLGLTVVMDEAWVATLADPQRPQAQLTLVTEDTTGPMNPEVSIEVTDVDAAYRKAVEAGAEIVYPVSDEEWGVRRFFVRDPDGHVVNVLQHRRQDAPEI
ncbi:VOC family protein [Nakamurella endophytica]|uniref:Glyoxalase n=1 Tax=Nakamurella endophytica TaxID=1748367 RepID=A0A917TC08_9ACTN|nr:VOC family protein [Nakamurella endophytica]GGM16681.1 glyoxalase [Nakamurella endophytica]